MRKLIAYLVQAEHTSVFEHITMTFDIRNVSRSFLAQITRHRMGSFTSASQHYQDYRAYPMVIHPDLLRQSVFATGTMDETVLTYTDMVDAGIAPEEARQVLPNAAAVNILWTVNMRSFMNFCRQRCCNRNVAEMRLFANKARQLVISYWPNIEEVLGPPCFTGDCNQGKMQCTSGGWDDIVRI